MFFLVLNHWFSRIFTADENVRAEIGFIDNFDFWGPKLQNRWCSIWKFWEISVNLSNNVGDSIRSNLGTNSICFTLLLILIFSKMPNFVLKWFKILENNKSDNLVVFQTIFWGRYFRKKKCENLKFSRDISRIEKLCFWYIALVLVLNCVKKPVKGYWSALASKTVQYRVSNCTTNIKFLSILKSVNLKIASLEFWDSNVQFSIK